MGGEVAKFQLPCPVIAPQTVGTLVTEPQNPQFTVQCPSVQATYPRPTQSIHGGEPPVLHVYLSLNVDGQTFLLKALVDKGAEVNIIRRGIIPQELMTNAKTPISLPTADSLSIQGCKLGSVAWPI